MKRQKEDWLTVHINMDKVYASYMDVMAQRLGVTTRTQVFEAGLISLANQMGISDMPDRLPNPARKGYHAMLQQAAELHDTRFLTGNSPRETSTQTV